MTCAHPDAGFTWLDVYITGQLALAGAELAGHIDTEARLAAILHPARNSAGQDPVHGNSEQ